MCVANNHLHSLPSTSALQTPSGTSTPGSPAVKPADATAKPGMNENLKLENGLSVQVISSISTSTDPLSSVPPSGPLHRKAISVDAEGTRFQNQSAPKPEVFPANYPLALRTQEAQFR